MSILVSAVALVLIFVFAILGVVWEDDIPDGFVDRVSGVVYTVLGRFVLLFAFTVISLTQIYLMSEVADPETTVAASNILWGLSIWEVVLLVLTIWMVEPVVSLVLEVLWKWYRGGRSKIIESWSDSA